MTTIALAACGGDENEARGAMETTCRDDLEQPIDHRHAAAEQTAYDLDIHRPPPSGETWRRFVDAGCETSPISNIGEIIVDTTTSTSGSER